MLQLLAAILLTAMFFYAGFKKITNFGATTQMIEQYLPLQTGSTFVYNILTVVVIAIELLLPILILYTAITGRSKFLGFVATISLAIFVIVATMIVHYPPTDQTMNNFLMHLGIIGGLIALSAAFY